MSHSRPIVYDNFVNIVLPRLIKKYGVERIDVIKEWQKYTMHLLINGYISKAEYDKWRTPHP